MNDSAYKISLDINEHGSQAVLKAKQSDTGRKVHISLRAGGTPYTIAENCYAVFEAKKPDGKVLYNACTIEGNEIIYEFTEQTCSAVGRSACEIKLYGLDEKLITSPRFALLVDGTVYPDGRVESSDEFSALTKMVSDTLKAQNVANEAAENANEATKNANDAAVIATEASRNANLATENANTAANNANKATQNATTATNNANTATDSAKDATAKANLATENANTAAGNANDASANANLAAKNANDSAIKAAHTAKSLMVVGEAKGESIAINDAINQYLVGLRVFGKTTQDGTPTPDAPVGLVNIGNSGSITVNVNNAQSMTIATPNGLPGVPVASGGNYTDANGQQWVCDEIDFTRGVYIKRLFKYECTGNENWAVSVYQYDADATRYDGAVALTHNGAGVNQVLCSHFLCNGVGKIGAWVNPAGGKALNLRIMEKNGVFPSVDALVAFLKAELTKGTPVTYLCILLNPTETPLTEEELAAYANLHTYKDHTTVSNDAGAYMELEYVMDAKKYIDSLVVSGGSIIPATLE